MAGSRPTSSVMAGSPEKCFSRSRRSRSLGLWCHVALRFRFQATFKSIDSFGTCRWDSKCRFAFNRFAFLLLVCGMRSKCFQMPWPIWTVGSRGESCNERSWRVDGVRSQGFSRPSLSSEQSSPRELCGHQDEALPLPKSQNHTGM